MTSKDIIIEQWRLIQASVNDAIEEDDYRRIDRLTNMSTGLINQAISLGEIETVADLLRVHKP